YKPQFDSVEGTFYCDVGFHDGASYFPFVQLGLARYQSHCAPGLDLSPPAAVWAQIPPRREGVVRIHDARRISIDLRGVGFHASGRDGRPFSDTPRFHVRLMRASHSGRTPASDDHAWMPVITGSGQMISHEATLICAGVRGEDVDAKRGAV